MESGSSLALNVPSYNAQATIQETLTSIQEQTNLNHISAVIECAIADLLRDISFSDSDWSWGAYRARPYRQSKSKLFNFRGHFPVTANRVRRPRQSGYRRRREYDFLRQPDWLGKVSCIAIEFQSGYSFAQFERDLKPFGFTMMPAGSAAGNVMNMAVSRIRVRSENAQRATFRETL